MKNHGMYKLQNMSERFSFQKKWLAICVCAFVLMFWPHKHRLSSIITIVHGFWPCLSLIRLSTNALHSHFPFFNAYSTFDPCSIYAIKFIRNSVYVHWINVKIGRIKHDLNSIFFPFTDILEAITWHKNYWN